MTPRNTKRQHKGETTMTKTMSAERLRLEARLAYLEGRVKRAKELNRLADQKDRDALRQDR